MQSTSALELGLDRLSLGSPYSNGAAAQPYGQQGYPQHHQHSHSATSSLEREQRGVLGSSLASSSSAGDQLQPHQVMQPPLHQGPPPHVQLKEPQRRRGVVKFFNSLKGFGFVVDNDPAALGGQEVFCHFSAIAGKAGFRSLAEGEEVEYELVQGPKGFQAANLTGPGGRTVVGDPKARMQKPPAYLPLAPYALPIGAPYLADPYQAQAAGVYAGSPYTQHVLYVPASAALQPSQYAYAPIPLAAPPPPGHRGGGAPPHHQQQQGAQQGSPFVAPQYQSYAAPPSSLGAAPSAGSDRYGALGRGGGPGVYGAAQQPGSGGAGGAHEPSRASSYGAPPQHAGQQQQQGQQQHQPLQVLVGSLPGPGFSPLGSGSVNLPGSPQLGPGSGQGFGGFAPFSPPSFNHAPLFGAPPQHQFQMGGGAFGSFGASGSPVPSQQQQPQQQPQAAPSSSGAAASALSGSGTTPSSALFGTTAPAPIGSRSGTPAAGGRSTPALGNGSLGSDAWKATPAGALYAGSNGGSASDAQL
ncbi:hypothetical protein JCM3775_006345 [Rhodotorula graminis]